MGGRRESSRWKRLTLTLFGLRHTSRKPYLQGRGGWNLVPRCCKWPLRGRTRCVQQTNASFLWKRLPTSNIPGIFPHRIFIFGVAELTISRFSSCQRRLIAGDTSTFGPSFFIAAISSCEHTIDIFGGKITRRSMRASPHAFALLIGVATEKRGNRKHCKRDGGISRESSLVDQTPRRTLTYVSSHRFETLLWFTWACWT